MKNPASDYEKPSAGAAEVSYTRFSAPVEDVHDAVKLVGDSYRGASSTPSYDAYDQGLI